MAATVAPAGHICVLRSNGDDGNRIPLDASAAATVTFGRALTSDVRIALAHCSRLHAELRVDQNARVSLVNHAKAANATLLNAQPLAPKAARDVRDGDVFEICGKRFRFEASVLAATTTMASITEEENVTAEKRDVAKPLPSGLLQAITARRRSSRTRCSRASCGRTSATGCSSSTTAAWRARMGAKARSLPTTWGWGRLCSASL